MESDSDKRTSLAQYGANYNNMRTLKRDERF